MKRSLPYTPYINEGAISFFSQQKFWRSVPQCDHLVSVQSLLVFSIIQSSQTPVTQLNLTPKQQCFNPSC